MFKRIFASILESIKKYFIDTILHALAFSKNNVSNGILYWFILLSVVISDVIVATNQNQNFAISVLGGIIVVLIILFIGYGLFLIFDFIPMKTVINRILPIRDKLDEIITNSEITNHSFTEPHEIENINKIIKLERIPAKNVLEVWLYKLKVQRSFYIILSPILYFMLSIVSLLFSSTHIVWINNVYNYIINLLKSPPLLLQVFEWAFIVSVVTNETFNINVDISRIELLKGLSKNKDL